MFAGFCFCLIGALQGFKRAFSCKVLMKTAAAFLMGFAGGYVSGAQHLLSAVRELLTPKPCRLRVCLVLLLVAHRFGLGIPHPLPSTRYRWARQSCTVESGIWNPCDIAGVCVPACCCTFQPSVLCVTLQIKHPFALWYLLMKEQWDRGERAFAGRQTHNNTWRDNAATCGCFGAVVSSLSSGASCHHPNRSLPASSIDKSW